jgi:hypothetical protein
MFTLTQSIISKDVDERTTLLPSKYPPTALVNKLLETYKFLLEGLV